MKFDDSGLVITNESWPGCAGDSCAETSRFYILTGKSMPVDLFRDGDGFVRHPSLASLDGWDRRDFSNDQALPMILATGIRRSWWRIPGTRTIVSPGVWLAVRGHWRSLGVVNAVQGLILKFPYRWSDDDRLKGKLWKFVRSDDSSADFLNLACIHVGLKSMGIRSRIFHEPVAVMEKISHYYRNQPDHEWLVKLYFRALTK